MPMQKYTIKLIVEIVKPAFGIYIMALPQPWFLGVCRDIFAEGIL
jgi:hypothetical protein